MGSALGQVNPMRWFIMARNLSGRPQVGERWRGRWRHMQGRERLAGAAVADGWPALLTLTFSPKSDRGEMRLTDD